MKQIVCDRCNKAMSKKANVLFVKKCMRWEGFFTYKETEKQINFDLCPDCGKELKKFMNN